MFSQQWFSLLGLLVVWVALSLSLSSASRPLSLHCMLPTNLPLFPLLLNISQKGCSLHTIGFSVKSRSRLQKIPMASKRSLSFYEWLENWMSLFGWKSVWCHPLLATRYLRANVAVWRLLWHSGVNLMRCENWLHDTAKEIQTTNSQSELPNFKCHFQSGPDPLCFCHSEFGFIILGLVTISRGLVLGTRHVTLVLTTTRDAQTQALPWDPSEHTVSLARKAL